MMRKKWQMDGGVWHLLFIQEITFSSELMNFLITPSHTIFSQFLSGYYGNQTTTDNFYTYSECLNVLVTTLTKICSPMDTFFLRFWPASLRFHPTVRQSIRRLKQTCGVFFSRFSKKT